MKERIYDEGNGLYYVLGADGMYYPEIYLDEDEFHSEDIYFVSDNNLEEEQEEFVFYSLVICNIKNWRK